MAFQYSAAARNAALDAIESTIGASPTLEIRTGAAPANCAAADTGTVLAILPLPADWMAAAAAGVKALLGTWQDTSADAAGTAGHFRIKQGATCHLQGSVSGANLSLVTNAITAANGNVLNFASTTGVVVGQMISGAGIPAGAQVLAVTATTVTMSLASVASGAAIAFGGDITLNNNVLAIGQVVSITAFSMTAGGA
jgi:hypothetical protein